MGAELGQEEDRSLTNPCPLEHTTSHFGLDIRARRSIMNGLAK